MQLSQLRTWFNTKFANQRCAYFLVNLQGLNLPAAPVIGKRKLGLNVLTERVLAAELPEFRNHLTFLAAAELGIDAGRDELEPQFVEAFGGPAQSGRRDVFQWGSAP